MRVEISIHKVTDFASEISDQLTIIQKEMTLIFHNLTVQNIRSMIHHKEISLPPYPRGFHLITDIIMQELPSRPAVGLLTVFIKHTSAGLTVNENYDPDVRIDYETIFNKLVPENDPDYVHTTEGPDDMPAHVKSSLVGSSITVPLMNGKPNFGTWQGIFLCEFRNNAGGRKLVLSVFE